MPSQGLTKRDIIHTAILLIEEAGCHKFSMRQLADRLNVKVALLYDHIENMDALYIDIGCYAISELKNIQLAAVEGKSTDEAVTSLAIAYRRFAKEHPELYEVITSMSATENNALLNAAGGIVEPIIQVLSMYSLTEEQKMHLQRVLRSIMHGLISQEKTGGSRCFPVSASESYQLAIKMFIWGIYAIEGA